MGFGEYLAYIFEYSSRHTANEPADPRMIRYGSGIYPENVDVELVIMDIENFRQMADTAESRLRPELLQIVQSLDYALMSKSSEGGKRMFEFFRDKQLATAQQMQYVAQQQGSPDPIDQGNYVKRKPGGYQ